MRAITSILNVCYDRHTQVACTADGDSAALASVVRLTVGLRAAYRSVRVASVIRHPSASLTPWLAMA